MLDQKVPTDHPVRLESLDTPSDPREPPDTQVFLGFQDPKDPRDQQATTERKETKAPTASLV